MSIKTLSISIAVGGVISAINNIGKISNSTLALENKIVSLNAKKLNLSSKFAETLPQVNKLNRQILKLTVNSKKLSKALKLSDGIEKYRDKFKNSLMDKIALGATVIAPLKVAIDFESAMADVKKVVNFDSNKELKVFQGEILKLSRTIPLSADGLAQIVASGGQLGIAKNKLLDFTTTTAKMSTAFDMLPKEAGDATANLMNIFELNIKQIGSLGDAINHLSDNSASKAKGIVNVLERVGGSAKIFGLSVKETSSLASAFLALGKPAEVAGTAINALLLKLGTADQQGNKFQEALAKMGLSSRELKDNIKKDGEGAIIDFLNRINEIDKDDRMGVLSNLFGAEYSDDIALLSSGINNYKKSINLLSKEQNYAGSMQREFDTRSKTTANNLILLKNSVSEIAINFGSVLLPAINSVITPLRGISTGIGEFVDKYPTISKVIGGLVAGAVAMSLGISAIGYAGSFAVSGILNVTKAVLLLNSAFIANPIGLIIVGIAGLIAIGVLLYNKFAPIRALFDGIWTGIKIGFAPVIGYFKELFSAIGSIFKPLGDMFGLFEASNETLTTMGIIGKGIGTVIGGVFRALLTPIEIVVKTIIKAIEIGSSVAKWFGFGENNNESGKKPISSTIGSGLRKATIAGTAAMQIATASPTAINNSNSVANSKNTNQTNYNQITINNPNSTVDVTKGINDAMNRSLSDDH